MDRSLMTNSFLGPMGAAFLYLEALNLQAMVAGLEEGGRVAIKTEPVSV